jgi:VCBS repeat-containing protein
VAENEAGVRGGGIENYDTNAKLSLINATVSDNFARKYGGGLYQSTRTLGTDIFNSTFTNNKALTNGGGVYNDDSSVPIILKNTIVQGNIDEGGAEPIRNDISGFVVGNAHNLVGDRTGASGSIGTGTDLVGVNPLLSPLQDNGGSIIGSSLDNGESTPILTHQPSSNSPAIDAGADNLLPQDEFDLDDDGNTTESLPVDQLSQGRIFNGNLDIGAVESHDQQNLPDAQDDTATTNEDNEVVINVLVNDLDLSGGGITITGLDDTGLLGQVNTDGNTVTYDPDGQFESLAMGQEALESFGYTITDSNGQTDSATVTVTIEGVNDTPVAIDDNATTEQGVAVIIDVLANDSDIDDGDVLSIQSFTNGSNGSVAEVEGGLVYTPNAGFFGDDSFTYLLSDGNGGTDEATVNVNVSEKPTLDIDGNSLLELQDYNLIDLYAVQVDEAELDFLLEKYPNDLLGENATRTDAKSIKTYWDEVGESLFDIDGNGVSELQDYNLIDLYAVQVDEAELGFLLEKYPHDLLGENPTRPDATSILAYFETIDPEIVPESI